MKFSILALASVALAYTVSEGSIKVGSQAIHFGEFNTQEIKQINIDHPKEKIDIAVKLTEVTSHPHQLFISISSVENPSLASHFVPTFTAPNLKLSVLVGKLPEVLKVQKLLSIDLIIADSKNTLYKHLGQIITGEELQNSASYTEKSRIGYKPEIHHIFKEDPATINAFIPVVFIIGAVVLTLALFGSWVGIVGGKALFNSFKTISAIQLSYNVAFLLSIIGFEYSFVKYYLGQSIFTTLSHSFVLGLGAIFFGSKVLRYLGETRKSGKF